MLQPRGHQNQISRTRGGVEKHGFRSGHPRARKNTPWLRIAAHEVQGICLQTYHLGACGRVGRQPTSRTYCRGSQGLPHRDWGTSTLSWDQGWCLSTPNSHENARDDCVCSEAALDGSSGSALAAALKLFAGHRILMAGRAVELGWTAGRIASTMRGCIGTIGMFMLVVLTFIVIEQYVWCQVPTYHRQGLRRIRV